MANFDTAFVQQIFHISQRKRKSGVQHHRQADDLWAGFEITKRRAFCHEQTLRNHPALLKRLSSDSAAKLHSLNGLFDSGQGPRLGIGHIVNKVSIWSG